MSVRQSVVTLVVRIAAVWAAAVVPGAAQETVSISVPMAVDFQVSDVSRSTSGTPDVTTINFSDMTPGKALRVSVRADAAAFTPPSGPGIPASNVAWNSLGGLGSDGTLSSSAYTLVYQSNPVATSGYIDLQWTLAAPGSGIRAGSHGLTIRWKLESITP